MDNKNNKNNHQGNGTDRADGSHSFGDSTVDYNEIEVNYSWPFAEKWALQRRHLSLEQQRHSATALSAR